MGWESETVGTGVTGSEIGNEEVGILVGAFGAALG